MHVLPSGTRADTMRGFEFGLFPVYWQRKTGVKDEDMGAVVNGKKAPRAPPPPVRTCAQLTSRKLVQFGATVCEWHA